MVLSEMGGEGMRKERRGEEKRKEMRRGEEEVLRGGRGRRGTVGSWS